MAFERAAAAERGGLGGCGGSTNAAAVVVTNDTPTQHTTTPLKNTNQTIRRESPKIGGNFANWGMMFSAFDCTCLYLRQKVRASPCLTND